MRYLLLFNMILLAACTTAAPHLSPKQLENAENLPVFYPGDKLQAIPVFLGRVDGADCSDYGGLAGQKGHALFIAKQKAVALGAAAVVNVFCSEVPLIGGCVTGMLCKAEAVNWYYKSGKAF